VRSPQFPACGWSAFGVVRGGRRYSSGRRLVPGFVVLASAAGCVGCGVGCGPGVGCVCGVSNDDYDDGTDDYDDGTDDYDDDSRSYDDDSRSYDYDDYDDCRYDDNGSVGGSAVLDAQR